MLNDYNARSSSSPARIRNTPSRTCQIYFNKIEEELGFKLEFHSYQEDYQEFEYTLKIDGHKYILGEYVAGLNRKGGGKVEKALKMLRRIYDDEFR